MPPGIILLVLSADVVRALVRRISNNPSIGHFATVKGG